MGVDLVLIQIQIQIQRQIFIDTLAVVKVRGNAGNAVPGPLKIAGERSRAPRSR